MGKDIFLEELKKFKQKYLQLEEECKNLKKGNPDAARSNGSNYQRGPSAPAPEAAKKKAVSFGDYEDTLSEMRNALQM